MADRYQNWTASRTGGFVAKRVGLPRPEPLRRRRDGGPALPGPVVTGGAGGSGGDPGAVGTAGEGRLLKVLNTLLDGPDYEIAQPGAPLPEGHPGFGALVFDATGITHASQLAELYEFFHSRIRSLAPCGRVLILSSPLDSAAGPVAVPAAVAQRAIEGFMRSVGKELRRGATANLIQVEIGAEESIESTIRFILSARSAYVSGQVLRISAGGRLTHTAPTPTADSGPRRRDRRRHRRGARDRCGDRPNTRPRRRVRLLPRRSSPGGGAAAGRRRHRRAERRTRRLRRRRSATVG